MMYQKFGSKCASTSDGRQNASSICHTTSRCIHTDALLMCSLNLGYWGLKNSQKWSYWIQTCWYEQTASTPFLRNLRHLQFGAKRPAGMQLEIHLAPHCLAKAIFKAISGVTMKPWSPCFAMPACSSSEYSMKATLRPLMRRAS